MDVKEAIERLRQDEDEMNGLCEEIIKSRNEAIETVLSELEKKDKIIELMATYIGEIDVSENLCNDEICHEGDNCNKCIKEYFTNKVEKERK